MRFRERLDALADWGDPTFVRTFALAWYILHAQYECDDEYALQLLDDHRAYMMSDPDYEPWWLTHSGPSDPALVAYGRGHLRLQGKEFVEWERSQREDEFKPAVQEYLSRHRKSEHDDED